MSQEEVIDFLEKWKPQTAAKKHSLTRQTNSRNEPQLRILFGPSLI